MTTSTGYAPRVSSMARRFAASFLAPILTLALAAGCSSTAMPMADGAAGATGNGGATGGGAGGHDAGDTCASLMAMYADAYQRALGCNPALDTSTSQCTALASPSLPCSGCVRHVNDTTELDQLRAQYDASSCPAVACPAIACINPGTAECVPVDGGTSGRCATPL